MGKHKNEGDPALALAEECAEVIQVISKKVRFNGDWNEIPEGKTLSRLDELKAEMDDVLYQWVRFLKTQK
jgi:NTP pyrophosphatase (non-canonical NTP hydrolase)